MRYDIEADWKLLDSCNYRCTYCFWPAETLGSKLAGLPGPQAWIDAFARTQKTWLLHISGGEPAIHPRFADLCAGLAERHYLSINSNLSRSSVAAMARRVPPDRVSLIHGAVHPHERTRRDGWTMLAGNVEAIRAHGHRLVLSIVATPEVLADFEGIARACTELTGLRPVPKLLRGGWQGRGYPSSYTQAEKAVFRAAMDWARQGYAPPPDDCEAPTVWPLEDDAWLDRRLRFRGRTCEAGRRFVSLHPDGAVYRCGTDGYLGNLLEGDFAAAGQAQTCDSSYCFYFCRKYSRVDYLGGERSTSVLTGRAGKPALAVRAIAGS